MSNTVRRLPGWALKYDNPEFKTLLARGLVPNYFRASTPSKGCRGWDFEYVRGRKARRECKASRTRAERRTFKIED